MNHLFFNGWEPLARTMIVGSLAYISMVLLLRMSGNRTLSKMNAFDFIVTIALGSTLASALLSKSVALSQAVAAFALLIGAQFLVTWLSVRVSWVKRTITGEPTLLFHQGQFIEDNLRRARVTHDEILSACRATGAGTLADVGAVVMETDGSFSVFSAPSAGPESTAPFACDTPPAN